MSHKGNDMYNERMKENADEMLHEQYNQLKRIKNKVNIKIVKSEIKRIKAMYKSIGAL